MITEIPKRVLVVGPPGCGKTSFIERVRTGYYSDEYVATDCVCIHPIRFHTTHGEWLVEFIDTSGSQNPAYYPHADLILDLHDHESYPSEALVFDTDSFIVATKTDTCPNLLDWLLQNYADFCISNKTWKGVQGLVLGVLRRITGIEDLELVPCVTCGDRQVARTSVIRRKVTA